MKRILALIPLVLVFILTLAVGSQNGQLVQFNYLIAQGEFLLSMLLGFFFGGGFLLGWLVFGLLFLRLKMQNRTLNRTMRRQSRELELARSAAKE
ncbi:LapA family protein [Aeromonas hydrophila]